MTWDFQLSVRAAESSHARSSDGQAIDLDALFRLYSRDLKGFAFRRLRDREAAADVVQDGFLRCMSWQARQVRPATLADARNVLWRVVSNLTIDFVRRKKVRGELVQLDLVANIADPYPTPDRVVEGRQAYRLVKMVLDEAPPVQRSAFLLYRLDGCSYADIANRLGVSPTTAARYIVAVADRLFLKMADLID